MKRKSNRIPPHVAGSLSRIRETALKRRPVDPAVPSGERRLGLELIIDRAEAAVAVVASVSSRPDGYSSTTPGNGNPGGGKGGGPTIAVPLPSSEPGRQPQTDRARLDPERDAVEVERLDWIAGRHGGSDRVPVSSTERAALDPGRAKMAEIDAVGARLVSNLAKLDSALAALDRDVAKWDRLRQAAAELDDSPQCYVASVVHRLPWDLDWAPVVRTRFAGYLDPPFDEERPVSRWVYDFVRKHRRLPTGEELREYLARGAVRVRTGTDGGAKP